MRAERRFRTCYNALCLSQGACGPTWAFFLGRHSGRQQCAGQADNGFVQNMSLLLFCIRLRSPSQTRSKSQFFGVILQKSTDDVIIFKVLEIITYSVNKVSHHAKLQVTYKVV